MVVVSGAKTCILWNWIFVDWACNIIWLCYVSSHGMPYVWHEALYCLTRLWLIVTLYVKARWHIVIPKWLCSVFYSSWMTFVITLVSWNATCKTLKNHYIWNKTMQQNFDNELFFQFNIMGHNKMGVQRSTRKNKHVI